jgi:hypothetical protein
MVFLLVPYFMIIATFMSSSLYVHLGAGNIIWFNSINLCNKYKPALFKISTFLKN